MIVVGGEALVDLVEEHGLLSPVPGGGPFNTAIALGRLGIPVAFLGTLSHDEYGGLLARLLLEAGVDMSLVRWSDAPTPLAIVHRQNDGENSYTFYLTGTSLTDLPPEAVPALPEYVSAIHVGTLGLAGCPRGNVATGCPGYQFKRRTRISRDSGRRRICVIRRPDFF